MGLIFSPLLVLCDRVTHRVTRDLFNQFADDTVSCSWIMDIVNTGPVIKCLAKYLPACQPVMYFICASNEMTNMQLNSDKSEVVMLPPRAGSLFYKYSPTSYLTHTDS